MGIATTLFNLCIKYQLWYAAIGVLIVFALFIIIRVLIKTDKNQALYHQAIDNKIDINVRDIELVDRKAEKALKISEETKESVFNIEKDVNEIKVTIQLEEKYQTNARREERTAQA